MFCQLVVYLVEQEKAPTLKVIVPSLKTASFRLAPIETYIRSHNYCVQRVQAYLISEVYILEPPTNGKVILHTAHGDLDVELSTKEHPKACLERVRIAANK